MSQISDTLDRENGVILLHASLRVPKIIAKPVQRGILSKRDAVLRDIAHVESQLGRLMVSMKEIRAEFLSLTVK